METQSVLGSGTPAQVRDDVRRQIDLLVPGRSRSTPAISRGGFVFATVHNIQADVPVENLEAMREAVREFGGGLFYGFNII